MASLTQGQLRELYRYLLLTRGLEEKLDRLLRQGQVAGDLFSSRGQEGTAIGAAFALEADDWLSPSNRETGALLVRGLDPRQILLQYMGRAGSPTAGKDHAAHITLPELGLLGPIGPLGAQLCVLNGVALGFRLRGEARVCMTFLGEGASRTGAAHEGLNFAAVQRLPLVVILVHNRWAVGTRSDRQAAVAEWLDVASAYGVPATSVDGNDVLQVYDEAKRAVDRARRGGGTTMVVAETYRISGHAQHDRQEYVPEREIEEWEGRDPIDRLQGYLVESGFESRSTLETLKEEVRRDLAAAVDQALSAPMPEAETARTGTFEGTRVPEPWTRRTAVYADLAPARDRS